MERTLTERLAEAENARMQRAPREADTESMVNWEKLLELAFERPGALISIARSRAPEASSRALREKA
jgi:hypothetical protein